MYVYQRTASAVKESVCCRPYTHFHLWKVVLASWSIALIEYCFQVPANRYGHGHLTAAQLKTIQEILTLVVFAGFSIVYLKESLRWNHLVPFVLIIGAAYFMFKR